MRYSELISELEYWKRVSGEEDPEIVINDTPISYEIDYVQPVLGIENKRAIGIIFSV
jgi:hypothetical protein